MKKMVLTSFNRPQTYLFVLTLLDQTPQCQ